MDILIKGMEMPEKCKDCRFWMLFLGSYLCFAQNKDVDVSNYTFEFMSQNRLPNCPLVALPKHRDLIQRDNLLEFIEQNEDATVGAIYDFIQDAPTIVEATE